MYGFGSANVVQGANPECDNNGGASPYVCVKKSGADPVEDVNFEWDFTDADKPGVTFKTGDTNWEVWSQVSDTDDTPANLGDLKITPSAQSSEDFDVKIANGTNPGAANLGSAVLTAANWTGSSSVKGGRITGDLDGALTVVDDGSSGGELYMTIDGDADAAITATLVPDGQTLSIGGLLNAALTLDVIEGSVSVTGSAYADITVTSAIHGGSLTLLGDLRTDVVITVADLTSDGANHSIFELGTYGGNNVMWGQLVLTNGVPQNQTVNIWHSTGGHMPDAAVDLNDADVAGLLYNYYAGNLDFVDGGDITSTGDVIMGFNIAENDYDGSATFASVADGATIEFLGSSLEDGSLLRITGNMAGDILLSYGAGVESGATLQIDGDVTSSGCLSMTTLDGTMDLNGDLAGDLTVTTSFDGSLDVASSFSGDIETAGSTESSSSFAGSIDVGVDWTGDLAVEEDSLAAITIGGALGNSAEIVIGGYLYDDLTIGEGTHSFSLIWLGHLEDDANIVINGSEGNFDAAGDILIGEDISECSEGSCSGDCCTVYFDGTIDILDNGLSQYGDFTGKMRITGCHSTLTPVDVCIEGTGYNNIDLVQDGCSNQVYIGASCP
jgi:hypothetical protein